MVVIQVLAAALGSITSVNLPARAKGGEGIVGSITIKNNATIAGRLAILFNGMLLAGTENQVAAGATKQIILDNKFDMTFADMTFTLSVAHESAPNIGNWTSNIDDTRTITILLQQNAKGQIVSKDFPIEARPSDTINGTVIYTNIGEISGKVRITANTLFVEEPLLQVNEQRQVELSFTMPNVTLTVTIRVSHESWLGANDWTSNIDDIQNGGA